METIGFIGLGIMGQPMAENLREADYELVVYNRTEREGGPVRGGGGQKASSPREVAEKSDIVITMLPDSPQVEELVLGEDGVAAGVSEGKLYIDMSSIAPATSRAGARGARGKGRRGRGRAGLGRPARRRVGGPGDHGRGSDDAVERARPILEVMGKAVTHIGPPGAGQVAKAANQVVVALTIQAVAGADARAQVRRRRGQGARGATWGPRSEQDPRDARGAHARALVRPGVQARAAPKGPFHRAAGGARGRVPLLATAQAAEVMNALIASGHGDEDHAVIASFYEELAGVSEAEAATS